MLPSDFFSAMVMCGRFYRMANCSKDPKSAALIQRPYLVTYLCIGGASPVVV